MTVDEIGALIDAFEAEADRDRPASETPDIGIIMGSDSDLDTMYGAYDALTRLGFEEVTGSEGQSPSGREERSSSGSRPQADDSRTQSGDDAQEPDARFTFESYVVSAHRTPELMYAYGETADDRGLDVIIAGAGGKSADLPNMTASIAYPIPVIGVPVQEKSVDSVIGMPTGAPITAVDAGKSFNAALSAVQILAREHAVLEERLIEYHEALQADVGRVSNELHELGTQAFREPE